MINLKSWRFKYEYWKVSFSEWRYKRFHKCSWRMTHHNRYGSPTREECKCGAYKEKKVHPAHMTPWWRWEYSDGNLGPWMYLFHRPAKTQEVTEKDLQQEIEDVKERINK